MFGPLLPRTDAGAFIQLLVVVGIGVPLVALLIRRRSTEAAWFVGGLLVFLLGFFALRTMH